MADATSVKVPELSRATAEFVRRVIKKVCNKSGLQERIGSSTWPPVEYLSSIRLGRWFSDAEYPALSRNPGLLGYGFLSGLEVVIMEKEHFFLSFFPDHPPKPQLESVAEHGYGFIDLTVVQQYIEEGSTAMLKMYASRIRAAIVEAIRADEEGLNAHRRPPFDCPDIDPEE